VDAQWVVAAYTLFLASLVLVGGSLGDDLGRRRVFAGHEGNDPSRWTAALDGLHTVKPVVVTEWGFQPRAHAHYRGTAKTFGIKFRDRFLQGRGLHSTAWCWSASYGPSLFKRDWRTRTVWGDFAYDYLRAHNRAPVRP
jgi:hypothetical protein